MQFFANLFLLAHQLRTTIGLRVLDNGIGPPLYGAEGSIVDYALLDGDQKEILPSQVQAFCFYLLFPVHHLLVCNFNCFVDNHPLLSTSSQIWESLDWVHIAATTWQWRAHL